MDRSLPKIIFRIEEYTVIPPLAVIMIPNPDKNIVVISKLLLKISSSIKLE